MVLAEGALPCHATTAPPLAHLVVNPSAELMETYPIN
jgi:hypothetical protein